MKIKIENYENMTPEEKLAALEAFDPEKEGFVPKATFDKTASEAAAFKKQLREKQTAEEAQAEKDREEREALLARVEELEREKTTNAYVTSLLGLGYDEKMAKATADALVKGDIATVFANQKTYIESREKALRSELLDTTPAPVGGGKADAGTTKKEYDAMTLAEKVKFANENPDKYKEFYGGN